MCFITTVAYDGTCVGVINEDASRVDLEILRVEVRGTGRADGTAARAKALSLDGALLGTATRTPVASPSYLRRQHYTSVLFPRSRWLPFSVHWWLEGLVN